MALLALPALLGLLLGATGGLVADPAADGEPCIGCAGCESGQCGSGTEDPFTSHHHCCTTCCLAHAPLAFAGQIPMQVAATAERLSAPASVTLICREPNALYHPPRA